MAAGYFNYKEHSISDEYFERISIEMQTGICTGPDMRLRGLMTENVE